MSYGTPYLDYSPTTRKGGKGYRKMSNNKSTSAEVSKASKAKYAKTRGEHYKDIVIAILIAGIIAFIGGMHFANQHTADVSKAVSAVAQAQPAPKK